MSKLGKALLGLAVGTVMAMPAKAATTWDYFAYTGVTHPVTVLLREFADEVKKRTNGELIINVRPAGELPFKASEVVKIVGEGQVQMGSASPGFIAGSVNIGTVGNHEGLIRTYEEMAKAWPIIFKYVDPHFQKAGARTLFAWSWPTQHVFGTGKPIRTLEDFAGRKIRTVAPQEAEMLKRLNASSVALTTPEVAVALERGVMDGLISAPVTVVGTKWNELLKWVYVSSLHMGGPNYELINIDAYNKLPANVKTVLDQVAKEWTEKMNVGISSRDTADMKDLRDKYKLEMIEAKPEDMKALDKKMEDYWESWAKDQGPDGVAMMKELRAALGR